MRNIYITAFLLLVCLIMISGMTSAYFTAQSDLSDIFNTTGTLEIDLDAHCDNWDDWKPGEENAKQVTWTIQNNGNKQVYLRAKINGQWSSEGINHCNETEKMNAKMPQVYHAVTEDVYGEPCNAIGNGKYNTETTAAAKPSVNWEYTGSEWYLSKDGYWYCKEILNPGEQTELGFNLSLDSIRGHLGAEYKIDLTAEVIQANDNAIDSVPGWNILRH